jgi:hypothetical protein
LETLEPHRARAVASVLVAAMAIAVPALPFLIAIH